MYQEPKPIEDEQPIKSVEYQKPIEPVKPAKKSFNKIVLHVLFILILGGAVAGVSYWWRDKTANEIESQQTANLSSLQKTTDSLRTQLAAEKVKNTKTTVVTNQTACTPVAPSASVIESIKASITSGNTAALEGYMAASVNTILAATEAYGPQTAAQSVSDVTSFIADATSPWNFALTASILSSYGSGGYEQYFPNNAIVGKSANGKVISFSFDCNAKISTVFLAASEELLAQ